MARMLGRMQGSHCPSCHGLPGIDCADKGTTTRRQKRIEQRATDTELEAGFAEWADETAEWGRLTAGTLGDDVWSERAYVSALWADDWDSPEDTAAYG